MKAPDLRLAGRLRLRTCAKTRGTTKIDDVPHPMPVVPRRCRCRGCCAGAQARQFGACRSFLIRQLLQYPRHCAVRPRPEKTTFGVCLASSAPPPHCVLNGILPLIIRPLFRVCHGFASVNIPIPRTCVELTGLQANSLHSSV